MSVHYRAIQWNRHKRIYDAVLGALVVLYLAAFIAIGGAVAPGASTEMLLIRGFGTASFILLTALLCIGPLARLSTRFAPLLYNRRHLGVAIFLLALAHAALSTMLYHGFGNVNPLVSLLSANREVTDLAAFPFELLGIAALIVLFLMAATSHDFWLANLSPRAWKSLHMFVYPAWAFLVMHIALGVLQDERSPLFTILLIASVATVAGLHLAAAVHQARLDARRSVRPAEEIDLGDPRDIPDNRARIVHAGDQSIAVFRQGDRCTAISNVCAHQGGPLGEGKIVDGCVTCPWHGYQYRPDDGQSPPPYTEKLPTYNLRVEGRRLLLDPKPNAPGAPTTPARIPAPDGGDANE